MRRANARRKFGQAGGINHADTFGHTQAVFGIDGDIFGVTAAVGQGDHFVADGPALHVRAFGDDFARDFEARQVGCALGCRVEALALHDVGTIDAGSNHLDQYFMGFDRRQRTFDRF